MFLKLSCDFRFFFGLVLTQKSPPFNKGSLVWPGRQALELSHLHFLHISALWVTYRLQLPAAQLQFVLSVAAYRELPCQPCQPYPWKQNALFYRWNVFMVYR